MRWFQRTVLICLTVSPLPATMEAQDLQYRGALVEEGTRYQLNESSPFNYGNRILPQPAFGNLADASLFLNAGAVSAAAGFTAATNNLVKPEYQFSLREISMDLSLTDDLNLLIGKKILKWGTGYAFNPTGVVEPQRSPSDPTDRLNLNDGRTLISLTAFQGKSSLTFVYLNDVKVVHSSLRWGVSEYAVRANTLLGGLDLSFVGHYLQGDRLEVGTNGAYVIGDGLELHYEVIARQGSSALYHRIVTSDDAQQIFDTYPYLALYEDSRQVFFKSVIGGQYTFDSGVNVVLEYYHNAEGLSTLQWQRWMNFVKFQDGIQKGSIPVSPDIIGPSRMNLLWSLQTLSPHGTMRDYLFARGTFTVEEWGVEMIGFLNASDMSVVLIPAVTWKASGNLSAYLRYTSFLGKPGSEFGSLFTAGALTLGIGIQL